MVQIELPGPSASLQISPVEPPSLLTRWGENNGRGLPEAALFPKQQLLFSGVATNLRMPHLAGLVRPRSPSTHHCSHDHGPTAVIPPIAPLPLPTQI